MITICLGKQDPNSSQDLGKNEMHSGWSFAANTSYKNVEEKTVNHMPREVTVASSHCQSVSNKNTTTMR